MTESVSQKYPPNPQALARVPPAAFVTDAIVAVTDSTYDGPGSWCSSKLPLMGFTGPSG